jgi:hypothetical protein
VCRSNGIDPEKVIFHTGACDEGVNNANCPAADTVTADSSYVVSLPRNATMSPLYTAEYRVRSY